jgi:glycosyltransferase involved in cell wall biosynthesis
VNKSEKLKIVFLVTNDLVYDQRVLRHANSLKALNFEVELIGRIKPHTDRSLKIHFPNRRFKMLFNQSWMFYAEVNIRFFFYLLVKKFDVIWANDLDTLPAAYFISRLRKKKLFYDSHEFFTGVPELENRDFVKSIWVKMERYFLKRIPAKITVSEGIANLYFEKYKTEFDVIRNISSDFTKNSSSELPNIKGFQFDKPFFIYQGALNKERGVESIIEMMKYIENYQLLLIGHGDLFNALTELVKTSQLTQKVFLTGLLSPEQLKSITPLAVLGFSVEKPSNDNYRFCLPNKIFDYIQAGIPTVAYPNYDVKQLFGQYEFGLLVENHDPKEMARSVLNFLVNEEKFQLIKNKLPLIANELSWENESNKLMDIFNDLLNQN